jgi:hypothetical protein
MFGALFGVLLMAFLVFVVVAATARIVFGP